MVETPQARSAAHSYEIHHGSSHNPGLRLGANEGWSWEVCAAREAMRSILTLLDGATESRCVTPRPSVVRTAGPLVPGSISIDSVPMYRVKCGE